MLFLSLMASLYYFNRQKTFKNRFKKLITDRTKEKDKNRTISIVKPKSIPDEKIKKILKQLEVFESKKNFCYHPFHYQT